MSGLHILMYHSISGAGGPVAIPPPVFAAQMAALAAARVPVIGLDALLAPEALPPRAVILTFDDGFADFATHAWPILRTRSWPVTVFLPSGQLGGMPRWPGACPRPLMDWETVARLAAEGVGFGGHSVSHPDLTALAPEALAREIGGSRDAIAARTGRTPRHFAPPYGRAGARERAAIAAAFATSSGTELGEAGGDGDPFDLPRLEMHYFRDPARLRAQIEGRGGAYLRRRQVLRRLRGLLPARRTLSAAGSAG
jgi:peptidoglycan/xylan/chitin deacetylase (PgdA/CDA1 family)